MRGLVSLILALASGSLWAQAFPQPGKPIRVLVGFAAGGVPYDPVKDFTPLSLGSRGSQILVLHTSIPAVNVRELLAWAKDNPGKLNAALVKRDIERWEKIIKDIDYKPQ